MRKILSKPLVIIGIILGSMLGWHFLLWVGYKYVGGYVGELSSKIQGFSVTPFFMEFFFSAFGLLAVLAVNSIRRKWAGEDFIEVEINDDLAQSVALNRGANDTPPEDEED